MKNEKHKKWLGLFVLFLEFFGILFVGFCICNAMAVAIDCMFEGFGPFLGKNFGFAVLIVSVLLFCDIDCVDYRHAKQNKITLLLVVFTPIYATFGQSFAEKIHLLSV